MRPEWRRGLACLAAILSLGLVHPAMVADGHEATGGTSAGFLAPNIVVDQLPARSAEGRRLGTLVLPAIVDDSAAHNSQRPLLVVFNGGPGAASGWLQLGLLGPLRAVVPDDPSAPLGQHLPLMPNREGLWDAADMLFVDPLGTGFSRAAAGVDPAEIRDWRKDGDYLAGALRDWMARHDRQGAPVILMGESYGAERAVAVADALIRGPKPVRIAGLVLISQTVTTETGMRHQDSNIANAIGLPTIAATACYFGKSGLDDTDPAACAAQSHAFAMDAYLPALTAGEGLSPARRSDTIAGLAELTGLAETHFEASGLAVNSGDYRRQALAATGRVLGMYDSRYSAQASLGKGWQDPSLDPLLPVMQDAAERYGRAALKLDRSPLDESRYVLFDPAIHAGWRYGAHSDPYGTIDMAGMLRSILHRTDARLLVAGGMFDTVSSYGADRYLVSQLRLPPERVTLKSYPAGHMFYLDSASRRAFLPLLRDFVEQVPADASTRSGQWSALENSASRARNAERLPSAL